MPNAESLATLAQLKLIQTTDDDRTAGDAMKLPAALRTQVNGDFTKLDEADAATAATEGDRAGGSATARAALTKLAELLHEGYKFIDAIRGTKITDAQRRGVFAAYGWVSGNLGRFGDARVIGLSRLAVKDHEDLHAEWRYPADLVADLVAQLGIFDANTGAATGGGRQGATKTRNTVLDDAGTSLAQVRFYYCSASRDTDQTPELAAIGFQPRRDMGAVVQAKAAAVVPAGGS